MQTELEKTKQKLKKIEAELELRERMLDRASLKHENLKREIFELWERTKKEYFSESRYNEALRHVFKVATA